MLGHISDLQTGRQLSHAIMWCNVQWMYVVQVFSELMDAALPAFGPCLPESLCASGMSDAVHTCLCSRWLLQRLLVSF